MQINVTVVGWDEGKKGERDKIVSLTTLTVIATLSWLFLAANPSFPYGPEFGASPAERKIASRLHDIAQKTEGEWSQVSPDDKQFIVSEISSGDEVSAKILLRTIASHLKGASKKKSSGSPTNTPSAQ